MFSIAKKQSLKSMHSLLEIKVNLMNGAKEDLPAGRSSKDHKVKNQEGDNTMPILGSFFNFPGSSSYAESQKNKYKDLIDAINVQLERTLYLDEEMEALRGDYDIMEVNPDSAEGKLSTTYVDKEAENRQSMETLYNDYVTAISEVRARLAEAQSQYEYWCSEVEKERLRAKAVKEGNG